MLRLYQPGEGLRDAERVGDDEPDVRGADGVRAHDGEEAGGEGDEVAQVLQPDGQPPVGDDAGVVAHLGMRARSVFRNNPETV